MGSSSMHILLRTSLAASLAILAAACGSEAAVYDARAFDLAPGPPAPRVLMEFVGTVDVEAGTMTIQPLSQPSGNQAQQALTELPVSGTFGSNTVELTNVAAPTTVPNGCGTGINSFEGQVFMRSFYAQQLANVYVELTAVVPTTFEGCLDEDATQGLSSQSGLFRYGHLASGGNATATWRFKNPGSGNFSFVGRVMGEVCTGSCLEAFVDENAACSELGNGTQATPFCTVTTALAHGNGFTSIRIASGTYGQVSINRTVQLVGGLQSGTYASGGAATIIESTTNDVAGVTVTGTGVATLEKLTIVNNATNEVSGFVDGVFVESGGNLVLRNSNVSGGTTSVSRDANAVHVAGTAVIENCSLEGGVHLGLLVEDNATALAVDAGGTATVTDSDLFGALSARGFSYGLLLFGTATLARNVIDGGQATAGLFSLGIRSKDGSVLRAASNRISGGTNFKETYGIWNSGVAVIVNNTIDGGEPFPNGALCSPTTACVWSGSGPFPICKMQGSNPLQGFCATGTSTAVRSDNADNNPQLARTIVVNNIMTAGGAASTGFPCTGSCPVALDAHCAVDECRFTGGTSLGIAGGEVTTLNNLIADGFLGAVGSIEQVPDIATRMNDCDPPPGPDLCVSAAFNIAVAGSADLIAVNNINTLPTSAAVNAGADPSTLVEPGLLSGLPFTLDIDGATRPVGSAWDIGADEQ